MEDWLEKIFEWFKRESDEGNNGDIESEWEENEIRDEIADSEKVEPQGLVEKALVRCTCCKEQVSQIFVYKRKPQYLEYSEGTNPLNHKDTIFKETFEGCINTEDAVCEIEILDDIWFDFDEDTEIGDGYGIDEENSYMICKTGYGMIYVTQSGQKRKDMEDRLEDELLDRVISEEAFWAMEWPVEDGIKKVKKLKIVVNYGSGVFEELKSYMKRSGIVNAVSIKMFLATIRSESGGILLEQDNDKGTRFLNEVDYSKNVRGAGLMQLSVISQKVFLEYKYKELQENDPMKKRIKNYIDGFSTDGKNNTYDVAQFIADNYPVESATWYWAVQKKMSYSEGSRVGKNESLNEFVTRHANDNQYNTFAATQMAVNGTAYGAFALDRFSECENDCEIKPIPSNGCNINHWTKTGYCFVLQEDLGNNGGVIERHDYGPGNWTDREDAYHKVDDFFNNGM